MDAASWHFERGRKPRGFKRSKSEFARAYFDEGAPPRRENWLEPAPYFCRAAVCLCFLCVFVCAYNCTLE